MLRRCDDGPQVADRGDKVSNGWCGRRRAFGMQGRRQWVWKALGWVIVAGSIYYVGSRLIANAAELATIPLSAGVVEYVAAASSFYGVALLLMAMAWGVLLIGASRQPVSVVQVISVSGRSQILKYLPGNVFHFAGRQVLGAELGWSQLSIATATIVEIALLVIGALVAITVASAIRPGVQVVPWIPQRLITTVGLAGAVGVWLLLFFAPLVAPRSMAADSARLRDLAQSFRLAAALLLYLVYFAVCAFLFWGMVSSNRLVWDWRLMPDTALAFSMAWLAGYVTPGAPGGMGVREAVMVYLLTPLCGEVVSLAAALAMRVTTTLGDFLFFVGASWCHARFVASRS